MSKKPPTPKTRVYLAANSRDTANAIADTLTVAGFSVGSLWHREPLGMMIDEHSPRVWMQRVGNIIYMIQSCDVCVWICEGVGEGGSEGGNGSEGAEWPSLPPSPNYAWELWFALGASKRVAVLGELGAAERTDKPLYHPSVRKFQDVNELVEWLKGVEEQANARIACG